jgi:hypothetical protein
MYKMPVSFNMLKEFDVKQKNALSIRRGLAIRYGLSLACFKAHLGCGAALTWFVPSLPRAAKPLPRIGAKVRGTAHSKVDCLT